MIAILRRYYFLIFSLVQAKLWQNIGINNPKKTTFEVSIYDLFVVFKIVTK
jgi:hypothetical protein